MFVQFALTRALCSAGLGVGFAAARRLLSNRQYRIPEKTWKQNTHIMVRLKKLTANMMVQLGTRVKT